MTSFVIEKGNFTVIKMKPIRPACAELNREQ